MTKQPPNPMVRTLTTCGRCHEVVPMAAVFTVSGTDARWSRVEMCPDCLRALADMVDVVKAEAEQVPE